MLELPFNRSGRLKNANRDVIFVFPFVSSPKGSCGAEGIRFITLWTNPIEMVIDNVEFNRGQNVQIGGKFYIDPKFDL
jgi:hypothetical protein